VSVDEKISYEGNEFLRSFQVNRVTGTGYNTQL